MRLLSDPFFVFLLRLRAPLGWAYARQVFVLPFFIVTTYILLKHDIFFTRVFLLYNIIKSSIKEHYD